MTEPTAVIEPLIATEVLLARIDELAGQLAATFEPTPPVLVAVMDGARVFAEQLVVRLPGHSRYREVRAASYGAGTTSSGAVRVDGLADLAVDGQRVVLIEDIVDTGRTVQRLCAALRERGADSVEVITLLNKPSRRVVDVPLAWVGFEVPDLFVVGFGMDVAGRYRDLPHIGVYRD